MQSRRCGRNGTKGYPYSVDTYICCRRRRTDITPNGFNSIMWRLMDQTRVAISDDIRERVFMSQLGSLVESVHVVRQLESARKACQATPSVEEQKSLNVVSASADSENISTEIHELKDLIVSMNEKICELEKKTENEIDLAALG
ncbi:hypothetical protein OS493_010556 [Desmophyllum pertusum]|uniref:Uncharacterized protein n=1 Tax=Desmophyllum pertusum TaxID=174260 RepID=A0A9W9ZQP1_9CNID|nr:hypothetical protein OS493_010556 [Desmophyllum pertusum]